MMRVCSFYSYFKYLDTNFKGMCVHINKYFKGYFKEKLH